MTMAEAVQTEDEIKAELADLEQHLARIEWLQERRKVDDFQPYPYQLEHFSDRDGRGNEARQRCLMAANRVGKTFGGAAELSYHVTGQYPEWWNGHKFDKPILAWACGVSSDTTRDIIQTALLGDPGGYPETFGTGAIPFDCLDYDKKTTKRGATTGTLNEVRVRHVSGGWSVIGFKAYEQGEEKFMGKSVNYIWLDEEPPTNIYTQCITRTADNNGFVVMTYTPEKGMTATTNQFLNDIKPGQKLVQATWDDVPHLDENTKEQLLAQYTPQERDMRSRGIPIYGSGQVFPVAEDNLAIEPFDLPEHWPRIGAIDFGWDHPTAAVWMAHDEDSDTVYVYDCYRQNKTLISTHASAMKRRGAQVPIAWPHDGMKEESGTGKGIAQQYRDEGLNMMPSHFTNPQTITDKAGKGTGNYRVEPGIAAMLQRMETGNFKVFSHLEDWFQEYRQYYRKEGKIVKEGDDLMSATRYAHQSLRFARVVARGSGSRRTGQLKYDTRGIV
jgi:phage terminase large subunit-like protein